VSLILPYGNFTIGADIKDKEGAVTRINITDISTDLPTRQMYDNFMHSKNLDNADAAGDQAQMNMVTQALSSLMNARMPRNNGRPTTTSTTTTTTTTTSTQSPESDEPTEKEIEEAAKTRARMVKSVESIMNVDTLNSLEQIGSALTALAGRGKGIDNEAKEVIIKLLNKTVTMASSIQVESPQQLMDFLMVIIIFNQYF
jgi:HAMP domain-containing protein